MLPLYHPLRLISEICMLDQMSGGRLELSFGRGASPIEIEYFGVDPELRQDIYAEAVEVILSGLTTRRSISTASISISTMCRWRSSRCKSRIRRSGMACTRLTAPSARQSAICNVVSLDSPADTRLSIDRYRATWRPPHPGAVMPKLGLGRFIVVAETDAEALAPRPPRLPALASQLHAFAAATRARADPSAAGGLGCDGGGRTRRRRIARDGDGIFATQLAETGCNYVVGQFAFGDLTRDECLRSIGLFASEVMPALRASPAEKTLAIAK